MDASKSLRIIPTRGTGPETQTTMAQSCMLGCVLVTVVVSLGLLVAALMTDNWYNVSTSDSINPDVRKAYNFHYGLWKVCYDDMPANVASDSSLDRDGSCVYIHERLIQKNEGDLNYDNRLRIHLSRTVLGCSIAAAVIVLAALMALVCGSCPCRCEKIKKPGLYLGSSIILLLATLCGITSGVSFIALRDLDDTTVRTTDVGEGAMMMPPAVPEYASQAYDWSFMLHWIGTGLAFLDSFVLLCMMRNSYDFVNEDSKFSPYSTM